MRKLVLVMGVLAVAGLMLAMGPSARADQVSFELSTAEGGGTVASPETVSVTTDVTSSNCPGGASTCVTVVFTPPSGTLSGTFLINVNGDFDAYSSAGTAGAGEEDTFGKMSEETGSVSGVTSVTIYLTPEGGNSWASAADVLTPTCPTNNSDPSCVNGYNDGSENDSSAGYNPTTYKQGFDAVAGSPQDAGFLATPEPASFLLFGTGLLGFAGILRRKFTA